MRALLAAVSFLDENLEARCDRHADVAPGHAASLTQTFPKLVEALDLPAEPR